MQKKQLISYSFISIPLAFASLPIYIYVPDFYITEHGFSLDKIALVLFVIRLIDAIQDPLIGFFSDSFFHSFPRRINFVFGNALFLSLGMFLLFHPEFAGENMLLWFFVGMLVCTTAFSAITINYYSFAARWSDDYHQRTLITSWREGFSLFGLLLAAILPTLLQNFYEANQAFHIFSIIFISALILACFLLYIWSKGAHEKISFVQKNKRNKAIKSIFQIKGVLRFYLIFFLNFLAASIPAVLIIFFVRDLLNLEKYLGLFLLVYFLSGAVSMFFWQKICSVLGKEKAWLISMFIAVLTFFWAYFLGEGDFLPYLIICATSGVAVGADLAIPPSIVADMIGDNEQADNTSLFFSISTFLTKSSFALASAFSLYFLSVVGFESGKENGIEVLDQVSLLYAIIPCGIKMLAAFLLITKNVNKTTK